MTSRPALSTPRPLPRKRKPAKKRPAIALASVDGTSMQSNSSELTPAKAIQKDEAPLARRKPIQTNEALADARQGRLARLDALRIQIRALITDISHAADIELLDLMADEVGSFARHKTAQDAHTWAATAGITLETGQMPLARIAATGAHTTKFRKRNAMSVVSVTQIRVDHASAVCNANVATGVRGKRATGNLVHPCRHRSDSCDFWVNDLAPDVNAPILDRKHLNVQREPTIELGEIGHVPLPINEAILA
ncbi:protein of unknown function [Burkholderia multivorans]